MIQTIYGPMEEKHLAKGKKTGAFENENEITTWVEYWIEGVLVHRSVDIKLKKGIDIASALQGFK